MPGLEGVEMIDGASAEFERVVRQLPADSWDRPTPSEISVRELIEHVVVGNRFTAQLLAGVGRDEAWTSRAIHLGMIRLAVVDSARQQSDAFAAIPRGSSSTVRGATSMLPRLCGSESLI